MFTVLCANKRPDCVLSLLPVELLVTLLEVGRLSWDAFPPLRAQKRKNATKIAGRTAKQQKRRKFRKAGSEASEAAAATVAGSSRLGLERDTDPEQDLEEPKNSQRSKKSRRGSTVTTISSPAVSPTQDPPSEAHAETRRVRQRRRSVRVVES